MLVGNIVIVDQLLDVAILVLRRAKVLVELQCESRSNPRLADALLNKRPEGCTPPWLNADVDSETQ